MSNDLQDPCLPCCCYLPGEHPVSAVDTATAWATKLLLEAPVAFFAADSSYCNHEVVVAPVNSTSTMCSELQWVTMEQASAADSPVCSIFALSVARAASFGACSHRLGYFSVEPRNTAKRKWSMQHTDTYGMPTAGGATARSDWKEGSTPIFQLQPETLGDVSSQPWFKKFNEMQQGVEELRGALRGFDRDHPAFAWLQQTADRVNDVDPSAFAESLLGAISDFSDGGMLLQLFPAEYEPLARHWIPRKPQACKLPEDFHPTSIHSLIMPRGIQLIEDWVALAVSDLKLMAEHGPDAFKHRKRSCTALAIGQDLFYPPARGIVWDLRSAHLGIVVPLDHSATFQTHLNLDYLLEQCESGFLVDYPDQEILSHLFLGARYKDDLELQLVLLPHLLSFADGCNEIQAEVEELTKQGWYSLHSSLPFAPGRNIPRGIAPKAGGKKRPTSEVGAPRTHVADTEGHPVVPQNVAIKAADWAPEWKPTVAQFLQALAVLLMLPAWQACQSFSSPTTKQNATTSCVFHQNSTQAMCLLLDRTDGSARWVSERVLPFGVACASTIAQSWGHVVMTIVRGVMDTMEAACGGQSDAERSWHAARAGHFSDKKQCRLYYADLYTDDAAAAIIGVARTVRFLVAWFETTTRLHHRSGN